MKIDNLNMSMTVQSGVKLLQIHKKANSKKLFFPVSIAPSDKCTIGGNISTNVGGLQTLRYGNIEDHINGLEVVLSDGTVLNLQSKLNIKTTSAQKAKSGVASDDSPIPIINDPNLVYNNVSSYDGLCLNTGNKEFWSHYLKKLKL